VLIQQAEPVSTTRSRGADEQAPIPMLQNPPADVVAAVVAAGGDVEPTNEAAGREMPPVAPPAPEATEPAAPEPEHEASASPAEEQPSDGEVEDEGDRPSSPSHDGQAAASRGGAVTVGGKRKGRGSNTKVSATRSTPPPAYEDAPAKVAEAPTRREGVQALDGAKGGGDAKAMHEGPMPAGQAGPASDLDERFFDHGEQHDGDAHAAQRDGSDLDGYDAHMERKLSPEARARRAKIRPYVLVASAACLGLAVIGLAKNRAARSEPFATHPPVVKIVPVVPVQVPDEAPKVEAPKVQAPAASASAPVVVVTVPSGEPAVAEAPAASARFQEPVAVLGVAAKVEGTDPASATPPPAQVGGEPTEADKKNAVKEKRSCQALLDQGAFAKAVEAGERSVALDPADGEAWLMLGAAYQSMGKGAEARRSFSSCVAEGKKGPIGECRAMLH
jgi:hypothetical protein